MDPLTLILLTTNFIWLFTLTVILVFKSGKKPPPPPKNIIGFRFSLVKFNPFQDTGGEQSFVVSLLDPGGSGILLTSLNGRGISRLYAKRVVAGKPEVELSTEEKQALSQALNQKPIPYE